MRWRRSGRCCRFVSLNLCLECLMKETISKNLFLNALVCPTLGWRLRADDLPDGVASKSPTLADQFRMEQGVEIGRRARQLFPDGVLISTPNLSRAAAETAKLVRAVGPPVLFEATFVVDGYAAKADVLRRIGDSWHLIEVKSNVNLKQELIDDVAYTLMVLSRAGLTVSKASLLLISKDFRLGMEDAKLFAEYNCTQDALVRSSEFQSCWDTIRDGTSAAGMPEPTLIPACKGCELFSDCLGKGIENHIFDIPRLSPRKVDALTQLGVVRIEAIPQDFELTAIQARVRQAVVTGRPWVSPNLREQLNAIRWPAHYLDFETMMTALPLYPDTAPYTQIPTQYSIHKCTAVGEIPSHVPYICDPTLDSRRDLAQRLIADLQGGGSIITYSNFEKTTINGLATLFPDMAGKLSGLTQRIFNLEAVIRDHYYHPAFRGRTSVKATLPALLPGMSYDTLNIKGGDSASAAFAMMALGRYSEEEVEKLKEDLTAYCGQDTLAMVKLVERLSEA
ncbi:MAG: DUF2779 domain-containing protein [Dehalococcoidia bacterium]|nr:DUF2779 domain-containing protein [Dehalococcoidia bacterium]